MTLNLRTILGFIYWPEVALGWEFSGITNPIYQIPGLFWEKSQMENSGSSGIFRFEFFFRVGSRNPNKFQIFLKVNPKFCKSLGFTLSLILKTCIPYDSSCVDKWPHLLTLFLLLKKQHKGTSNLGIFFILSLFFSHFWAFFVFRIFCGIFPGNPLIFIPDFLSKFHGMGFFRGPPLLLRCPFAWWR